MDALTWFKSVFRGRADSALLRADLARESWADVPLRPVVVVRAQAAAAAAPDDQGEDWEAVIARARVQMVTPRSSKVQPKLPPPPKTLPRTLPKAAKPLPQPPARDEWADTPDTPLPLVKTNTQWAGDPDQLRARLDALLASGRKNAAALRPR